jgi:hypothetical protein
LEVANGCYSKSSLARFWNRCWSRNSQNDGYVSRSRPVRGAARGHLWFGFERRFFLVDRPKPISRRAAALTHGQPRLGAGGQRNRAGHGNHRNAWAALSNWNRGSRSGDYAQKSLESPRRCGQSAVVLCRSRSQLWPVTGTPPSGRAFFWSGGGYRYVVERDPNSRDPIYQNGSLIVVPGRTGISGRFLTLRHGRIDQRHILNVLDRELINVGGGVKLLQRGHGSGCGGESLHHFN